MCTIAADVDALQTAQPCPLRAPMHSVPAPVIRPYQDADLVPLQAMALALYAADVVGESMTAAKVQRSATHFQRHPDRGRILVVESAGALVGYVIVVWFWSNEYDGLIAVIDELWVEPRWRGQGIASALFARVLADHPEAIALDVEVSPENAAAQGWYQRRGFSPIRNLMMRRRTGETVCVN